MIEEKGLKLNLPLIRKILKTDIDYSYRKAKKVEPRTNTENSLVHRQKYAQTMLELLTKGKRIINVDESFIDQSNYTRRSWGHKQHRGSVKSTNMKESLKIFAALDTDGNV